MKRIIITLISIACLTLVLTGCAQSTWLYRVSIQQGNIITADLVRQLRIGMSREKVCDIIGPPVLIDTFNDNRWDYIYTYKSGRNNQFIQRKLLLYFRNDSLTSIRTFNIN